MMLYIKACHIMAMVAWFAGLFYLPRLFVYHADSHDAISSARFIIMERRLFWGIAWPAALTTTVLGALLLTYNWHYYLAAPWMHAKLGLVGMLWVYHLLCGYYLRQFAVDSNQHSARFYRFFNELPTLLLVSIVLLVIVKPF